jgi:Ca2+-binding EF-hand superfamily protein
VSVEDTVRLFNYYDKDRSGSLSYAEFMKLLQNSVAIDYRPMVVGEDTAVTVAGGYDGDL